MSEIEALPFAELLLRGARAHPDRDCMVLVHERTTYACLLYTSDAADESSSV